MKPAIGPAMALSGAMILGLWQLPAAAADCYVSLEGFGRQSGTSPEDTRPWQDGLGVERCLAQAQPGDSIVVAPGDYSLSQRILWDKSGEPGAPIRLIGAGSTAAIPLEGSAIAPYGQLARTLHSQWPTIQGSRPQAYSPATSDEGSDFIQLEGGVSHVEIANFTLLNFRKGIDADRTGNQDIRISNLYAENIRELLYIVAGCSDLDCKDSAASRHWEVSNLYVRGLSKRLLRADGLQRAHFQDIFADVQGSDGQMHWDDWPLLFHFSGPSAHILVERTIGRNPVQRTGKAYDNGDCYTAETHTRELTFRSAHCLEAYDAAFDLKGGPHLIENAIALQVGNRAFRVWDGPVTIRNSLAAYDGQGDYTQQALGSNAALWIRGEAIVDGFTSLNSTRPFILASTPFGCGRLSLSNSLMVVDSGPSETRSLSPQNECQQTQPLASLLEETNVEYRSLPVSLAESPIEALATLTSRPPAQLLQSALNSSGSLGSETNSRGLSTSLLRDLLPLGFTWPVELDPAWLLE